MFEKQLLPQARISALWYNSYP